MNIIIRDERRGDEAAISALTTAAFKTLPVASGTEAAIIDLLRDAGALTLSLVAEQEGEIVGHAAFSPAKLDETPGWFGLGPISVRPALHKRGIGTLLMEAGLGRLRQMDATGCLTVGDPAYYGRFGFAAQAGLTCPGVPDRNALALCFDGQKAKGEIGFHRAFMEAG